MGSKGERSGFLSSSNHNFTFFSVLRKEIKLKGTVTDSVSLIPSPLRTAWNPHFEVEIQVKSRHLGSLSRT